MVDLPNLPRDLCGQCQKNSSSSLSFLNIPVWFVIEILSRLIELEVDEQVKSSASNAQRRLPPRTRGPYCRVVYHYRLQH